MRRKRRLRLGLKGVGGFAILSVVLAVAVFAPYVSPHDPNQQDLVKGLRPPSWEPRGEAAHLLGTDRLGRDILSRIIYGSRVSLVVAVVSVLLSAGFGTILGLLAGYLGRITQNVVMRTVDIVLALPFMLLALVVMSVLGKSLTNLILVFAVVTWVQYARVAFAQTLEVREKEFVLASQATGASKLRTMFVHILPNIQSPLIVVATLNLGLVILMESGLSFLGLGTPPEIPSWGGMLQDGRSYLNFAWWLTTFPGLAIVLTVMGFNLVGDWLRDRFDPKI